MSNTGISADNLLRAFPEVLTRSRTIQALGELLAAYLTQTAKDTRNCSIYTNIDTLPENVLDILAYDFKVDWYYASYSVEVKREIIKNCIKVHKTQGTRAGCLSALNAIFGGSALEEWMESGERPYHYAVGIPAASNVTLDNSVLLSTLTSFVPRRCVLEGGGPAYFSRERFRVKMVTRYFIYAPPLCGTRPYRSTHGRWETEEIVVAPNAQASVYQPPMTGRAITGIHPRVSTFGEIADGGLTVSDGYSAVAYTPKMCGSNKVL